MPLPNHLIQAWADQASQTSPCYSKMLTVSNLTQTSVSNSYWNHWNQATLTQSSTSLSEPYWVPAIMFTPSGSGALYYHTITQTTTPFYGYASNAYVWTSPASRRAPSLAMPSLALRRNETDRGRKALRRSIDLFRKFRPESEIKTFLNGLPLIIRGHQYDYRVRKRDDLLHHTMNPNSAHIPYDLHIMSKQGEVLAKGCVIVPGTPVIDQVLALILHVQDEEEESVVINTTNWSPSLRRRAPIDLGQRLAA
jgi:hypothetical protein